MIKEYLSQKAAPWVSAFVLIGGLAIAFALLFLQHVTLQAAVDLSAPTDVSNYNWTPPHTTVKTK